MHIKSQEKAVIPLPSLGVLIVLAIGFRLPALFLLRYGGSVPDWSDFRYYHELAALSAQGYFPDLQFWVEYPPLFPWLAVGAYRLSLFIPAWINPQFWFDLFLTAVLAMADAGSIVLIDRLGNAFWGKPAGRRSAILYAALFLPGFALLGWFDSLPTFFLLLTLDMLVAHAREPRRSFWVGAVLGGVAFGIGFMLKLFPVLAWPAGLVVRTWNKPEPLRSFSAKVGGADDSLAPAKLSVHAPSTPVRRDGSRPRRERHGLSETIKGLAYPLAVLSIGSGVILAIAAPFLLQSPATFLATFRNVLDRGSWMSPWAIIDGFYGPGVVPSLSDRLFFNASAAWGQPVKDPAIWYVAAAIGAGLYLWVGRAAARLGTPRAAIAWTGFTLCLVILLSRGFSQQFTVWLLPFVAIALPGFDGALLAILLTVVDLVVEGYLYVTLFPTVHHLLWISVTARTLLLLWLAAEFATSLAPERRERWLTLRRVVWRPVAVLGMAATLGVLVWIAPEIAKATLARNGQDGVVRVIRRSDPATLIVFTQQVPYDDLVADVSPRPTALLAEPHLLTWTGQRSLFIRLDQATSGHGKVILLNDANQPASPLSAAITDWLIGRYGPASAQKVGSTSLETFDLANRPTMKNIGVHFGPSVELVGMSPDAPVGHAGQPVIVTLHWQADGRISRDYTVSLQLLDGAGKLVAQHDAMPANNALPMSKWQPGQDVSDPITLALPSKLAPGAYRLIVVVYDHQTLVRLRPSGPGAAGDNAAIGTLRVE